MTDETPSDAMARRLVEKLVAAGLLRKQNEEALIKQIAAGDMKGEDWRLAIELATGVGEK